MQQRDEATREVLRSLSRREQIAGTDQGSPARMRPRAVWRAPVGARLAALGTWIGLAAELTLASGWDLVRGRGGPEARARRLGAALLRRGAVPSRFAQFAARRLELLDLPYLHELGRLRDVAPPLPIEVATARAAAAAGAPFDAIYEAFDPVPITSTAAACAYQAVLRDGDRVVVKVRRPEALARFSAHLWAIGRLAWILEAVSLVRPGSFRQILNELQDMATGDLDFRGVARSHRIYRRRARRDRTLVVTAARVYHHLSADDVTVSEFVSGVRVSELIAARRAQDPLTLGALAEQGIDPRRTARRLLQCGWWSYFEGLLFNSEYGAGEIVVRPGGRIVFVDMGDCGHTTPTNQRLQRRVLERMWRNDVGGAADTAVQLLSPLPFIDVYEFKKAIEARLWTQLFAMRDRRAPPYDRTSAGIWLSILECAHDFGVPVRLETVQMMRSSASLDRLVAELWPQHRYFRELERSLRRSRRRAARRQHRELQKKAVEPLGVHLLSAAEEISTTATRLAFWVETATRNPPVDFMAVSKKASYVASVVLRFASGALGLVLVVALARRLLPGLDERADLLTLLGAELRSGWFIGLLVTLAVVMSRRILFRLDDKDRDP